MSYTILIVDDDENTRKNISEFLTIKGYEVKQGVNLKTASDSINLGDCDIILLDAQLPDGYGPNLIKDTAHLANRPPIIMVTGFGDIDMAVDAMRNGAHDFIQKPIKDLERLESSLQRACEIVKIKRELNHLRETQSQAESFIIGNTLIMKELVSQAEKAAKASVSVLITGDSGTGKEVLAKYIHRVGARSKKIFVSENCAAIQPTMIEAELFGFEAHAFTGADKRKIGIMEVADSGILFLDEVASVEQAVQAKLLRAIENQTFRRVGGISEIHVDLQVIAASNRNLKTLINEGKFREDLYFRLKVVDMHLPTLKERREDIPDLVGYFINKLNMKMGKNITNITDRALQAMADYDWPGNIRELSHSVEGAIIFCNGETIDLVDLPSDITHPRN